MARILCVGSNLRFAEHADWDEQPNISDYDLVFLNLRDLEKRFHEFTDDEIRGRAEDRVFNIADPERVMDVLMHGGDIYAILPTVREKIDEQHPVGELLKDAEKDVTGISPRPPSVDFFNFFPAVLEVENQGGKSVDENSIDSDWRWYFKDSFDWDICFRPTKGTKDVGLRYELQSLVENRYEKQLASELVHTPFKSRYQDREIGSIYLLPLLDGWGFENLADKILEKFYPDIDIETEAKAPEWAGQLSTPRQQELEEKISELETELALEDQYRILLYGTGDSLEHTVHQAFRELGFEVQGEKEGRRDGLVSSDKQIYVLEIHGTTGGVKKRKLRQLYEWKEDNEDKWDRPVTGLYIVNPKRKTKPNDRNITVPPDTVDYVDGKDLHIVRTPELFNAISKKQRNELTTGDIQQMLATSDAEITF